MRLRTNSGKMPLIFLVSCLLILAPATVLGAGGFAKVGTFASQWERLARDSRTESLGGSDMALAAGPFAALTNASALPEENWVGAGYGSFNYYSGLDIDYLGATAILGPLRLNAVRARYLADPMLVRTAYNPEGTGETYDVDAQILLLNASVELTRYFLVWIHGLQWTAGMTYRYHDFSLGGHDMTGWDPDLGTTVRWSKDLSPGTIQFTGSAMLRNPFKQSVTFEDDSSRLPQYRNFGFGLGIFHDLNDLPGNDLGLKIMISTNKDMNYGEAGFFGDRRIGYELTLFQALSLRFGNDNSRTYADEESWGLGLTVPEWIADPLILAYDYAALQAEEDSFIDSRDQHTFTLGYRF